MIAITINASPLGLFIAFLGGCISILSPCVMPILPGLFGVVSGTSVSDLAHDKKLLQTILKTCIMFSLGFSFVYVIIVLATTSVSQLFIENTKLMTRIGGGLILVFASILLLNQVFPTRFFSTDKRPFLNEGISNSSAAIAGAAFGFGWSPCIGPILGGVLAYASTEHSLAGRIAIALAYCLGLCLSMTSIVYISFRSKRWIDFLKRHTTFFMGFSIAVMVVFGLLLLFDRMSLVTSMLSTLMDKLGLSRLVSIG